MPEQDRFPPAGFAPPPIGADFWSLRLVDEEAHGYTVRKGVAQPCTMSNDRGAMATVHAAGGYGYAATGDTSASGLARALERAASWARATAAHAIFDTRSLARPG